MDLREGEIIQDVALVAAEENVESAVSDETTEMASGDVEAPQSEVATDAQPEAPATE